MSAVTQAIFSSGHNRPLVAITAEKLCDCYELPDFDKTFGSSECAQNDSEFADRGSLHKKMKRRVLSSFQFNDGNNSQTSDDAS